MVDSPVRGEDRSQTAASQIEFFETTIRPLLAARCYGCHGEKKQWAGLRLDQREHLLKGGDSGPAVVPSEPARSLLISAVKRDGLEMPPDKPLSPAEVAALERWIRDGAAWPEMPRGVSSTAAARAHWAFQPVTRSAPPPTDPQWGRTPLDAFVLRGLQQAGLRPNTEADRRTLIRRLTYDLTGLPPTPEEVDSFVGDERPDAYERLVERLLESPAYGEHATRRWLDIARYSDTKGYVYAREERFLVQAPTYRDWVVRAFQHDLPYSRFLELQLAADQIAEQPADWAAMGFLTIGRRFLGVTSDIIDDRIDAVMRGMQGLTVGCARCHDHKYDPIPTADYYSLYGVFQNCAEELTPLVDLQQGDLATPSFVAELKQRQALLHGSLREGRRVAAERVRQRITDYLIAQTELDKYPAEGFDQILSANDMIPAFVRRLESYLSRQSIDDPLFGPWKAFAALPAEEFESGAAALVAAWQNANPSTILPEIREVFDTPPASLREVATRYGRVFAAIVQQHDGRPADATAARNVAEISTADPVAQWSPVEEFLYGAESPCVVPEESIVTIESFFDTGTVQNLWKLQGEVDRWIIRTADAPPFAVKVVDRREIIEPRVFKRGNPAALGATVPRHYLGIVAGETRQPFQSGSGRLELARAITHPANPLTRRVWVNRIWQQHFGVGLVETTSDFGLRASPPSHPELLDWLASWFQDEGESTKELHRLIVLSAAYRQSSQLPADVDLAERCLQQDPHNRLLWRWSPHRLTFEEFRDSLLAVSRELVQQQGGRGSDMLASGNRRRSLYGLIDRQFLPSVLRVFDFANPDLPIAERSETTVPQQALFLLNHPFLAARTTQLVKQLGNGDDQIRIQALYRQVLQRAPTADELALALEFLQSPVEPSQETPPILARAWEYGYGKMEVDTQRLSSFAALPYFNGSAWQGGPQWPDGGLGWLQLTATGGHPGNNLEHAVVRRWTAPQAGTVSIESLLKHEPEPGDGVRYWILSSRHGVLKTGTVHQQSVAINVDHLTVEPGDTFDFVVDILEVLHSDQFLWAPKLTLLATGTGQASLWDAQRDFFGPPPQILGIWEQLAHVLLCSNEFLFVD